MVPNLSVHQLEETEEHRCSKCHCTECSPVTWRRYAVQKHNVIKHLGDSAPPHPQYYLVRGIIELFFLFFSDFSSMCFCKVKQIGKLMTAHECTTE